jgi:CRP-like cAMP-binding protein
MTKGQDLPYTPNDLNDLCCSYMTTFRFTIDRSRFKGLSLTQSQSKSTFEFFDQFDMSSLERMFYRIWATPRLRTGLFSPGQTILEAQQVPDTAFVVVLGEVEVQDGEHTFMLGPGSTIGLAEGLCDLPLRYRYTATSVVNVKILPIPNAIREIERANPGLRGICRLTVQRILQETEVRIPSYLET